MVVTNLTQQLSLLRLTTGFGDSMSSVVTFAFFSSSSNTFTFFSNFHCKWASISSPEAAELQLLEAKGHASSEQPPLAL